MVNSLHTLSGLLIIFANSLDPDPGSKLFDTLILEFLVKDDFILIKRRQKSMKNYPEGKE